MNIDFHVCSDPMNQIDKNIGSATTKTGTLKDGCNVIDPVILVAFNPTGFNYAFIGEFGRYYFMRDIRNVSNDLWEVHLHVDVLKSFASQIKASQCIVAKNANRYNLYLNDPNYKCYQDDYVLINELSGGFPIDQSTFVLTCFGDKS